MEEKAKIKISLKDGEFEISGSEDFVSIQIENFKKVITDTIENHPHKNSNLINSNGIQVNDQDQLNALDDDKVDKHQFLYDYDEDIIKILRPIPGSSTREKMLNAALLYLYGKSLEFNEEKAPFSDIREICQDHGCIDVNNFSSALNSANELLNCSGSRKSQEAKLTFPGKQAAKSLVEEILNDED